MEFVATQTLVRLRGLIKIKNFEPVEAGFVRAVAVSTALTKATKN